MMPAHSCGTAQPEEADFGRFHVAILPDGDVLITRRGIAGRGVTRMSHMWMPEQVADALNSARRHMGHDGADQRRALEWAMTRMRPQRGRQK